MSLVTKERVLYVIGAVILIPVVIWSMYYHYLTSCVVWEYHKKQDVVLEKVEKKQLYKIKPPSHKPAIMSVEPSGIVSYTTDTVSREYHNARMREYNSKLVVILESLHVMKSKMDIVNTDIEGLNIELESVIGVTK